MKFQFELTPFRINEGDSCILMLGYPLFGGWLPFVGFVTFQHEDNEFKSFLIEWLLRGVIITSSRAELEELDDD
jgi:hypothetical protein